MIYTMRQRVPAVITRPPIIVFLESFSFNRRTPRMIVNTVLNLSMGATMDTLPIEIAPK